MLATLTCCEGRKEAGDARWIIVYRDRTESLTRSIDNRYYLYHLLVFFLRAWQMYGVREQFIQRASPACSASFRPSICESSERQISKLSKRTVNGEG